MEGLFATVAVYNYQYKQTMQSSLKIKVGVTSLAVALGCVGITFAFLKFRYRLKDAAEVFSYIKIKNVTTEKTCNDVISELRKRCSSHRAIGFDCEWVAEQGKRHPVALVQLSSYDGLCGIFRINQLNGVPESLKGLLEDQKIYKVGVAPADDARYLSSDYGVSLRSTLDVRHIALLCGHNPGGLANLAKTQLHVVMDKSWRIRCSDWEADTLTDRQLQYAAIDAHVAIRLFVKLVNELSGVSLFQWLYSKKSNVWSNLDDLCWKYADVTFKGKNVTNKEPKTKSTSSKSGKEIVLSKRYPHSTRTKPLYQNCFLEAPDGELLSTCDTKKALWYVEKNLADMVKEDPLTVRLRFEPSGRSVSEVGRYYQLTKENKCVVCGATQSYIRKNVVPREYRKYFPEVVKNHSSHDVLLLCVSCHRRSNSHDQELRARLAAACAAPLASGACAHYTEDAVARKVRSAARALLYKSNKHVLPLKRQAELMQVVTGHYGVSQITEQLLKEAADIPAMIENSDYESHGLRVVEYFSKLEGGLLRLEEIWREHFLATMSPKFMPALWSLTHNEDRLRVRWQEGRLSENELKLLGLTSSKSRKIK